MLLNKEIGLTLSSGGVKAMAHIGFLKVLLENRITPNILSGTSGGALVAAFYAAGKTPEDIISFFRKTPLFKFSLISWKKAGIIDSAKYQSIFANALGVTTFEALKYPLTIAATNLTDGSLRYFNKGDMIKPLIASSALPPYFSPIRIQDDLFVDGGILNNFPIEPIMNECDLLIGSFVNPVLRIQPEEISNILRLIQRVYHIGLEANHEQKIRRCNYAFMPTETRKIGVLDTRMIDKAYTIGLEYAQRELPKIKQSLGML